MNLADQRSTTGRPLNKELEQVLVAITASDESATELYTHLWDLHDGALRLASWIEELAELGVHAERLRAARLLTNIQSELFDHLVPNHLPGLREVLDAMDDHHGEANRT